MQPLSGGRSWLHLLKLKNQKHADHTPVSIGYGAAAEQEWNKDILATPLKTATWRFWLYPDPAVVLGASQKQFFKYDQGRLPIPITLRSSGGGAVLVGPWMIGISVALPQSCEIYAASLMKSYEWLGKLLASQLRLFDVPCEALQPNDITNCPTFAQWACFAGSSPWEVFHEGKKLLGLAQQRRANGILLVAGLLVSETPWLILCDALERPKADVEVLRQSTTCVETLLLCYDKEWIQMWIGAVDQKLHKIFDPLTPRSFQ